MSSVTRIARAMLPVAVVLVDVSVGGTIDMILWETTLVLRTHVHLPLRESESERGL